VDLVGLEVGGVGQQRVQDVHRLPHPARDEVREQRDIGIRDQPERDPAEPAVPDRGLGQQIVLPGVDLRAVGRRGLPVTPHPRHVQLRERVDDIGRRFVDLPGVGVLVPGGVDLVRADPAHMPGDLGGSEIAAVGERGHHVPAQGVTDLRVGSGGRAEVAMPAGQVGAAGQDVQQAALRQPVQDRAFQRECRRAPVGAAPPGPGGGTLLTSINAKD